jgi:hypothetical protein
MELPGIVAVGRASLLKRALGFARVAATCRPGLSEWAAELLAAISTSMRAACAPGVSSSIPAVRAAIERILYMAGLQRQGERAKKCG